MLLSEILVSLQNGLALLSFQTPLTLLSYLSVYHEEKHSYVYWSLELDFLTYLELLTFFFNRLGLYPHWDVTDQLWGDVLLCRVSQRVN